MRESNGVIVESGSRAKVEGTRDETEKEEEK